MSMEWSIEKCDWNFNVSLARIESEPENDKSPSPLSTHDQIADAFLDNKLIGMYTYLGEYFMLFLYDQDPFGSSKKYLRLPLLKIASKIFAVGAVIDVLPELVIEIDNIFAVAEHIVDRERPKFTEIYVVHETYFKNREVIYQHGWENMFMLRRSVSKGQTSEFNGPCYPFDFPPISEALAHYVENDAMLTNPINRRCRDVYMFDAMNTNLFLNRMRSFYQMRSLLANGFRRCFKNAASLITEGKMNWNEDNVIRFQFLCTLEQARWLFEIKTLFASCFDTVRGELGGPLDYRRECYVASRDRCTTVKYPQAHYLQKTVIDIDQLLPVVGSYYFCEPLRPGIGGYREPYVSLIRSNPKLLLRYDILEGNFVVEAPIEICDDVLGSDISIVTTASVLGRKLKEYRNSLHGLSLTLERILSDGTEAVKVLHVEVQYNAQASPKIVVWTRLIRDEYHVEFWDTGDVNFSYLYGQCWDLEDIDIVSMRIKNTKTSYPSALEELGGSLPFDSQSEARRLHNYSGRL